MLDLVESLGGGTEACVAAPPAALETAELPTEPSPVFDPVLALTRCFDSQRMVAQMIECFYRDVDRLLAQMRAALQQGDLTEVGRLGHHIKGTVVYLGARTTAEAAIQVERFIVSSGTADEARRAVDALEHECIALKAALRRYAKGVAKAL
jgi:HPt (histidine-containing phosphotransfer) domain-containing protein